MDVGEIIAIVDLISGVIILSLSLIAYRRLRGGILTWTTLFIAITAAIYVLHAAVEVFGYGEELYAETAILSTTVLAFTMVTIDLTLSSLGVKR